MVSPGNDIEYHPCYRQYGLNDDERPGAHKGCNQIGSPLAECKLLVDDVVKIGYRCVFVFVRLREA